MPKLMPFLSPDNLVTLFIVDDNEKLVANLGLDKISALEFAEKVTGLANLIPTPVSKPKSN